MEPHYSHAIILDFEATCDDGRRIQPQEIIEFPSVLLDLEAAEVVDEFQAFVRPVHHPRLTEFCKKLTGIRQSDIDAAKTFPEVLAAHGDWLLGHGLNADNALFVTCGDWDFGTMFPAQCPVADPPVEAFNPLYGRWQNIKRVYCDVRNQRKAPGMAGMLREMGLKLVGRHHRGIDDCRNIASLYKALLAQGASPEVTTLLPVSKYPPITVRFRLDQEVAEEQLSIRTVSAAYGLARRLFKRQVTGLQRHDGRMIVEDGDLTTLESGEELQVSA